MLQSTICSRSTTPSAWCLHGITITTTHGLGGGRGVGYLPVLTGGPPTVGAAGQCNLPIFEGRAPRTVDLYSAVYLGSTPGRERGPPRAAAYFSRRWGYGGSHGEKASPCSLRLGYHGVGDSIPSAHGNPGRGSKHNIHALQVRRRAQGAAAPHAFTSDTSLCNSTTSTSTIITTTPQHHHKPHTPATPPALYAPLPQSHYYHQHRHRLSPRAPALPWHHSAYRPMRLGHLTTARQRRRQHNTAHLGG